MSEDQIGAQSGIPDIARRANVPMRIYALAKELKIDSKELVDVCAKAGITGKGSALASLDDGEVEKLKTFLSGGAKKPAPAAPPKERPAPPVEKVASAAPRKYTRDDYIAPIGGGKVKVLGAKAPPPAATPAAETEEREAPKPKKKKEPVINLAKLPDVKQPPPKPKAQEQPAQKPEIRLPKDAITGPKKGRAPLEHLTKGSEKTKTPRGGKTPAADRTGSKTIAKGLKKVR